MDTSFISTILSKDFFIGASILLTFLLGIPLAFRMSVKQLEKVGQTLFGSGNFQVIPNRSKFFFIQLSAFLKGVKSEKKIYLSDELGSRHSSPKTDLFVVTPIDYSLEVFVEGALDRIGKSLGIRTDLQIGDPTLDAKFLIRTSHEALACSLLGREEFLELLRILSADRFFESLRLVSKEEVPKWIWLSTCKFPIDQPGVLLTRKRTLAVSTKSKSDLEQFKKIIDAVLGVIRAL